ncbi:SatD family protein [Herbiconiux moechotypicola]|uniref:SatD family protein n=1 Tax=Herbiconiux moechotypicola TaxID=637393 RepID=A0ABN3D6W1_9MICO|nr:SatD family protein [Herbiconiux moechotypicola]MCS5728528.1 SatD family protein [Herbiconiux moechotypicola]
MVANQVAVIVDIVESRRLADRRAAQLELADVFAAVDARTRPSLPLRATVGDEFQAVYPAVGPALEAILLARLALPEGLDCRFGLGLGEVEHVDDGPIGAIQDGSGWWRAREAIVMAHDREDRRVPSSRSWFRGGPEHAGLEALVNAYLLARDQVVGAMNLRARRLTYGVMCGRLQSELAVEEGITQSAVSQALRRSGGAGLVTGIEQLVVLP